MNIQNDAVLPLPGKPLSTKTNAISIAVIVAALGYFVDI